MFWPTGVDVMITNFPIFGVFLKYKCYDQFFSQFSFGLSQKRQFFAKFFGENILKIISSVPGLFYSIEYIFPIFPIFPYQEKSGNPALVSNLVETLADSSRFMGATLQCRL
jgi:hypothetical protein